MTSESEIAATAVDEFVKISLEGAEVALRLTASGGSYLAGNLIGRLVHLNTEKTRGATRMKNLLKRNIPLTCFSIRYQDLEKFRKAAKTYGILYTAITDKDIARVEPDANSIVNICVPQDIARITVSCLEHIGVNVIGETAVEQAQDEQAAQAIEARNPEEMTAEETVAALFASEEELERPEVLWTGEEKLPQSEENSESLMQNENTAAEAEGKEPKEKSSRAETPHGSRQKEKINNNNKKVPYNQFNDYSQRVYTPEEEVKMEAYLIKKNSHTQEERDALEGRLKGEKPSVRKELNDIQMEQTQEKKSAVRDVDNLVSKTVHDMDKNETVKK